MRLATPLFVIVSSLQHHYTDANSTKKSFSSYDSRYSKYARTALLQLRNLKRDDEATESPMHKQNDESSKCSCSPVKLEFVIDLSQDCETNTLSENSGILGSFCFIDIISNADANMSSPIDVEQVNKIEVVIINADDKFPDRHLQKENFSDHLVQNEVNRKAPIEITSVQYLEFDTSGDLAVLYQDDTHALNSSFTNGDSILYFSKSSFLDPTMELDEQMESVPGGASLILYGKNADGHTIRNRVFWIYNMECGKDAVTVNNGDAIGWVTINSDVDAWPAFCSAYAPNAPTISPRSPEPSYERTFAPTLSDYPAAPFPSSPNLKPGQSSSTNSASKSSKATTVDLSVMYQVSAIKSSKSAKYSKATGPKTPKTSKSSKGSTVELYVSIPSNIIQVSNSMSYDTNIGATSTESLSTKSSKTGSIDDGNTLLLDLFSMSYGAESSIVSSHFSKSGKSVSPKSSKSSVVEDTEEVLFEKSNMPHNKESSNIPRYPSKSSKSYLSSSKSSKSNAKHTTTESTNGKGCSSKSSKYSVSAAKSSKSVSKIHASGSTMTSYDSGKEGDTVLLGSMSPTDAPEAVIDDSKEENSDETDPSHEDTVPKAGETIENNSKPSSSETYDSETDVISSGIDASKYDAIGNDETEPGEFFKPNLNSNDSTNSLDMSFDEFDNTESYLPVSEEFPSEAKEMSTSDATLVSPLSIFLTVLISGVLFYAESFV